MFKLFVLAALVAIAAAAPQPGYVAPAVAYNAYSAPVIGASPLAYTAPVATYGGYGSYASPLAYSAYKTGYVSPYGAYASPYAYL